MLTKQDIDIYCKESSEYQVEGNAKLCKLWEIPRMTVVKTQSGDKFLLSKIDGMYSICYELVTGALVHLAAFTEVYPCKKKG